MTSERLWNFVSSYFETDDGSLPEIALGNLHDRGRDNVFAVLASYFEMMNIEATYVDKKNSLVESAHFSHSLLRRLEAAEIKRVQFVANELKVQGIQLPDLGILILPDEVILDYRMGSDWTPKTVFSFFSFLKELRSVAPDSTLYIPESSGGGFPEMMKKEFEEVFDKFVKD